MSQAHWDAVVEGRRLPDHPAVRAFSQPKIAFVREALGVEAGELSMLEIGAGNGFFSDGMGRLFRLTTLDFSRNMLRGNPAPVLGRVQGDARHLPFDTGSHDVVFCSNLLHHLEEPIEAVREMARVARRHVVLVEPNTLNPLMALFGLVVANERGTLKFTAGYTRRLGREAGLTMRSFSTQGLVVPNKTPLRAVAALRRVDFPNPLGFYHVAVFDT